MWKYLSIFFIIQIATMDDNVIKILLIKEKSQDMFLEWFNREVKLNSMPIKIETLNINDSANQLKICDHLANGTNLIIDIFWSNIDEIKNMLANIGVPYVKIDVAITPFLDMLDSYLNIRNGTDVTMIFEDSWYIDQTLYYWLHIPKMRMILTDTLSASSVKKLKDLRPIPNNYALFANTQNMNRLFGLALEENLVTIPERWNLVFLDFDYKHFNYSLIKNKPVNLLTLNTDICCYFLNMNSVCECPRDFDLKKHFFEKVIRIIITALKEVINSHMEFPNYVCNNTDSDDQILKTFEESLIDNMDERMLITNNNSMFRMKSYGRIQVADELIAKVEDGAIFVLENKTITPIKAFYSVGITHALPWNYKIKDPETGKMIWTGYCVDFLKKIAEIMNFDYEFIEPKEGTFGKKINGVWNGVVGDLASGRTDLAITSIIMTADKEEVIDFVAPYFEQTGIIIVMRKPVRKTSLFKFMTVLKLEVWFSIVAALIVTGFMIWFLDKYSPYSARNHKKAYPYPCREFSLKESFWFALTSFTPQGGGEAPKALSGRTLVAAYWLFVVLMLATFTANLAAFLTVERMQAPVQSLEQLARQSRINYTVVENSQTHRYFINMKYAEDILYKMWKELTLNASTDDNRYRVWDYPIKEQYGHILLAINDSNPVKTAEEGFRNVNEHLDGDYAFIHDSSEVKYEISKNCNLTEVGEVFGERPYAVAVQQGSHLQDAISKVILKLQKDRFFEGIQQKYWNHSAKGNCPSTDDNEGITLESLGGVFIATLFGLALAMITLAGEVLYYRRKYKKNQEIEAKKPKQKSNKTVPTITAQFLSSELTQSLPLAVKAGAAWDSSNIILYPKGRNRISKLN